MEQKLNDHNKKAAQRVAARQTARVEKSQQAHLYSYFIILKGV